MSDDELKRLLKGLFSDEPVELAPNVPAQEAGKEAPARSAGEVPPEEPPLARPPGPPKRARRSGKSQIEGPGPIGREGPEPSQDLIRRLWASSQAISTAADPAHIGQSLMDFAAQAGVDVARLLLFVEDDHGGQPATLEMCDGWTVDNRPAQPYGTRLPLSSYPLLDFMRADQPVVVQDVAADPRANDTVRIFMAVAGVGSFFIVPLTAGPNWLGALVLGRNNPSTFADDLVEITWTLAGQAAVAIQYLKRMDQLQVTLRTLAQRNAEQDALINNIPDGIYFKDAESRFTRINPYQASMLGAPSPEAAVGKTDWDFYTPEFAEQAWADERRIIDSKQPLIGRIEKTIRRTDGQERWVSATKIPLTDDKGEVTGLVGISRDVTDVKAAQEQAQRRATELQLAAEISKAASGLLDPDQLIRQAVNLIAERFALYYAGLFLVDETGEWAILRAGTGEAGRAMIDAGHRLAIGGRSMIGQCIAASKAGIALDIASGADSEPFRFDNPLLPDTRSELALPLISHGRAIGGLTIQSTAEAAFSQEDVAALQTMADQLANAVDNARLFQERERRIQELATVTEIGQAVASILDPDTLFETIHSQISRLFDVSSFYIAAYEEGSDEWESAFLVERGERQPKARYGIQSGITGYMIRTRQPLVFGTAQENLDFAKAHGIQVIGAPAVSWLAVPLIAADQCVGVMCVQNYDRENLYSDHDLVVFGTIAGQVAAALDNVRLLAETQRRAKELEAANQESQRRVRELGVLFETSTALSGSLEIDRVYRTTIQQITSVLGVEGCTISTWDRARDALITQLDYSDKSDPAGKAYLLDDYPASRRVLQHRQAVAIQVNDPKADASEVALMAALGMKSLLMVPLVVRDEAIGLMEAYQSTQEREFTPAEIGLCQTLVNQTAAAMENVRLFEQIQASLAETEARARRERIGREITANVRASIDADAIMRTAVRELGMALGRPAFVRIGNAAQLSGPPGDSPAPTVADEKVAQSQADRSGGRGHGRRRRGGK